ncbi:DUF4139 domain-containing protein [Desulfonauticus submarinus]
MRKKVIFTICLLLCSSLSLAKIEKIYLYPKGAEIISSAIINNSEFELVLPGSAQPETLTFSSDIENFSYHLREKTPKSIEKLKQQLKKLILEKQKIKSNIISQENSLMFWKTQAERKDIGFKNLVNFNKLILKNFTLAKFNILQLELKLKEIKKKIEKIKKKIENIAAKKDKEWLIKIKTKKKGIIRYSYFDSSAGWTSSYSLYALPMKKKIKIKQKAKIWQKTGSNWDNASIILVSGHFSKQLKPLPLSPWIIRQKEIFYRKAPLKAPSDIFGKMEADKANINLPIQKQRNFFDEYYLGKLSLKTGGEKYITLKQLTTNANYSYIIRPYISPKAFLQSKASLKHSLKLPPGKAKLFLDDTFIGKTSFSLWDKNLKIYFGNDPEIKTKFYFHKEYGNKGIFKKEKIYTYIYELKIQNLKKIPVNIEVEDAKLQSEEKNVKIKLDYNIKPIIKDNKISWKFVLQPQEEKILHYEYTISFPLNLNLDMGR